MIYIFLSLLGLSGLVLILHALFPDSLNATSDQQNLVHGLLWLSILGSAVLLHYRGRFGEAARHLLIWTGIALLLVLGYSFRAEFALLLHRLGGELMPARAIIKEKGVVEFRASDDGHFYINADVNGKPVRFMLDTGASDIVLTPEAADRIGLRKDRLSYTKFYQTASGLVRGAPVRLDELRVGPIVFHDIPASVNEAPMQNSLLGMVFLKNLSGYEVWGDTLALVP